MCIYIERRWGANTMGNRAAYTTAEIEFALEMEKAVYEGRLKRTEAIRQLTSNGFTEGSASVYLNSFRMMRRGETYRMALSNEAVELFLKLAYESGDCEALRAGLVAFNGNIDYYESVEERRKGSRPTLHSARALYKRYSQIAAVSQRQWEPAFSIGHDEAFATLGALKPGQHWSMFDVPLELARGGKAKLLVTTIWNHHSESESKGMPISKGIAILEDYVDHTLWYRVPKAKEGASSSTNRIAHWNRLELASDTQLPIIGVLKDYRTRKCSLEYVFDCIPVEKSVDSNAIWLQLKPRNSVWPPETLMIDTQALIFGNAGRTVRIASEANTPPRVSLDTLQDDFNRDVAKSLQDSSKARDARLLNRQPHPRKVLVMTEVFIRNPDVVAKVLIRADGRCEKCHCEAPFRRRTDGSPYLEVHHIRRLADDGEDTVENAQALCPNCHRESHFG
ncbi:HNH endonuclease [Burkholderia gladioli]|uniref:HNH endonuclease n=1 Tax=Burkholderia gladioli TaxID=28095 RepID=UPI0034DB04EF